MATTQSLEEQIQECERSIQEQMEHLSELKAAAERDRLRVATAKLPEGSLEWVSHMREWIDSAPGCIRCGSHTLAFEYENGWDAPADSELEDMSPEELTEEMPSLVERIHDMESLLDEHNLCSYCQHMVDKDD